MTWATKFVNDTGLDISTEKNILNYSDEAWAPLRVSNYQQLDYLFNKLFRLTVNKTWKHCIPGLHSDPSQRASNAESIPMWRHRHANYCKQAIRNTSLDILGGESTKYTTVSSFQNRRKFKHAYLTEQYLYLVSMDE